ncbi:MAG: DUF192 domain-containing protein [Verrucomicrobiota bacterium JB024]|nr:DUF192 domain-containing protein [Verrucomicrobiota bacterium JB024]
MDKGKRWLQGAVMVWALAAPVAYGAGGGVTFERAAVCLGDMSDPVTVEVAETEKQRNRGLMERTDLAADAGMLFLFDREMHVGFYMFKTRIPLDIAFFDDDKKVVAMKTMVPCVSQDPRRCAIYNPGVAFSSALEVNAGFLKRHGIKKGDRYSMTSAAKCSAERGRGQAAARESRAGD